MSYQSAVPGLIGIPVSVTPTTDAIYFFISFYWHLGKTKFNFLLLNLCGLPRVGKFPILWFGVPSDKIQVSSLKAYPLLEINKENKKIIKIAFLNIFRPFRCYSTVTE